MMKPAITIFLSLLLYHSTLKAKGGFSSQNLSFIENKGQVKDQYHNQRSDIDFKLSSKGLNVFIGNGQLHYQFHKRPTSAPDNRNFSSTCEPVDAYRMDVTLLNANKHAKIITEDPQEYYEQHHISGGAITAHSYSRITYKDIYPNIDWVLYTSNNQLEYEFIVRKGGNPANIQLRYDGATTLQLDKAGSLTATTPMGTVTEAAPYSYEGTNKTVASSFHLNNNTLSFCLGQYSGELTIDPAVVWGTYYGGEAPDGIWSIADDDAGSIYTAGSTNSINDIATVGSHQATIISPRMAFLVKFNTDGIRQWGTYFGGTVGEGAQDIAIDPAGNIYLTGEATSNNIATPGSHQESLASETDAYLAKFNNNGILQWATYFGGDTVDYASSVATDNFGNVYLSGFTYSTNNITTSGSFQQTMVGEADIYLAKFNTNGVLQWSTYYGDIYTIHSDDLCTDDNNDIYISGFTSDMNNIATSGSHQETYGGGGDNFIVKFNPNGQRIWSTYYGGSQSEAYSSIHYDGMGHIYLGGSTSSADNISTPGSHQPALTIISHDAFLVHFDTTGIRQWGTYYGHWGSEGVGGPNGGGGITTDDSGNVFIVGGTTSDSSIATECSHQQLRAGGWDNFIVKFNSQGIRLWGTYHGGPDLDASSECTYYNGSIYFVGNTESANGIGTSGSHDDTYSGSFGGDGFLIRLTDCETPQQPLGISGLTTVCEGDTLTYTTGAVCQATSYTWTLPNGWTGISSVDSIVAIAGAASGNVTVSANSACGNSDAQTLAVTVDPAPVPIIDIAGNLLSTGNYITYQWNLNGSPISGATSQTYAYTQPGQYTVTVTDANGCSNTSAPLSTNVNNISNERSAALYPNPNNGTFTLSLTGLNTNEKLSIKITDITGRAIQTLTEHVKNGSLNKTIDLGKNTPSGQYFIKLHSESIREVIRFTKH